MKCLAPMCRTYTNRSDCTGYSQGMCPSCARYDAVIVYYCDRCEEDVDSPHDLHEVNGQYVCDECLEELQNSEMEV